MSSSNKLDKLIKESASSEVSDRVGIFVSVLCCLHCMALPAFIIFFPSLGKIFQNDIVHTLTIATVVPVGLFSFVSKLKVHNNKVPLFIGIFGMALLLGSHLFHEFMGSEFGTIIEIGGSVIGGLSLIVAHVYNVKLCRCNTCHH